LILLEFLGLIPRSLLRRQKFQLEIAGCEAKIFAENTP